MRVARDEALRGAERERIAQLNNMGRCDFPEICRRQPETERVTSGNMNGVGWRVNATQLRVAGWGAATLLSVTVRTDLIKVILAVESHRSGRFWLDTVAMMDALKDREGAGRQLRLAPPTPSRP